MRRFEEKEQFLVVHTLSVSLIASEVGYFPQRMPSLSVFVLCENGLVAILSIKVLLVFLADL